MAADLVERARELTWYHKLELPGYTTPGIFDMYPYIGEYGIPESLAGKRVLEIGTWDGFWSFELERRGAEVVALDLDREDQLDWPPRRQDFNPDLVRGDGFRLAHEMLGSKVERVVCNVYDATPEKLGGQFDLVFCGSVLIHVRDQLLALERIAGLVKPGGLFISAEEYERATDLIPFPASRFRGNRDAAVVFWIPNRRAWREMLWYAGFDDVKEHAKFMMVATEGWKIRHVVNHARKR